MPEFSPMTFLEIWDKTVEKHSNEIFLIFENSDGDSIEWNYGDFDKEVSKTAGVLNQHGVRAGDSVHLALANCPAFISVWLAAVRIGAWIVPSDPMGGSADLASHIERTSPKLGFCAKKRVEVYKRACGDLPFIEIDETSTAPHFFDSPEFKPTELPNLLDRAAVMFTSGTTGIPKGVVNIVSGFGEPCGRALTSHKLVERVAFTGGPETARHIIRNSADNLSQVSLELGGKSPVAVFEDADQENALNGITAGIFGASGQSCIAGSRLYIQNSIYDNFLEKIVSRANKIKLGPPMDAKTQMGPLNSLKQLEIIEKNIKLTLEQGGKLRCGGKRHTFSNKGYYFPPTIIECDNHNLPTAENELFGPVLSVMKFNDEKEVINKMNDNQYGLSSGVYTKDINRGLRVSNAIRAGITFVNTYRLISPSAPFGGMKDSGYGKEAGIESIKDYTRIKTTWFNTSDKPMDDPFTMG